MTPSDSVMAGVVGDASVCRVVRGKEGNPACTEQGTVKQGEVRVGWRRETPARHRETSNLLFRSRVRYAVTTASRDKGKYPHRQNKGTKRKKTRGPGRLSGLSGYRSNGKCTPIPRLRHGSINTNKIDLGM